MLKTGKCPPVVKIGLLGSGRGEGGGCDGGVHREETSGSSSDPEERKGMAECSRERHPINAWLRDLPFKIEDLIFTSARHMK